MICDFVCDQVLVVDLFNLKGLRGCVLILSDEFLGELPPHQWFGLCIGAQVVSALFYDTLVKFVEVDMTDADFWLEVEAGAASVLVSTMCPQSHDNV